MIKRDFSIIASNIYLQLCQLDEGDRRNHREPRRQRITDPAANVRAYSRIHEVATIAEKILLDMRYMESDPRSNTVWLTQLGRENCGIGIEIPP